MFGSRDGRLSSWAIIVMVIWLFNMLGSTISHPMQALLHFLKYYGEFDWLRMALTVSGPVSVEDLSVITTGSRSPTFFSDALMSEYR